MQITGTPQSLLDHFLGVDPLVAQHLAKAREMVMKTKREVEPYQAAALHTFAAQYNAPGETILEIGTAYGYTVAVMALAAPQARVIGLNPTTHEADAARQALRVLPNVEIVERKSWDYLPFASVQLSMVFVDGDHKRVAYDLPYWNHLRVGGFFVHHDYSPAESERPCPPVFTCLNAFADWLGREPDELIVDNNQVGMAGWLYQSQDPVYGGHLRTINEHA